MKKIALLAMSAIEEQHIIQEYQQHPVLNKWLEEQSKFKTKDNRIILPEDRLLIAELAKRNIHAETIAWDDSTIDWSQYALCIVRSAWFWHVYPEKFFNLASTIEKQTILWNSVNLMQWIANKKYLLELEKKNIPITPTILIPAQSSIALRQLLNEHKWNDVIIKPTVSQGARKIIRSSMQDKPGYTSIEQAEVLTKAMLKEQEIVIQLYLHSVETEGEVSVIVINNKITHAVRRFPSAGSFLAIGYPLTKEEFYPLDATMIILVEDILSKIPYKMDFGRFDFILNDNNQFLLSEIELISPRLFLQYSKSALDYWVDFICYTVR